MKIVGIIPARAGSKRLADKNTRVMCGRPLWEWSAVQAHESGVIDAVAVTTNDDRVGRDILGKVHPLVHVRIERPEHLSRGQPGSMIHTIRHAYSEAVASIYEFDALCILQPSSPLRTGEDIAACAQIMETHGAESVVSVSPGPDDLCFIKQWAGRMERVTNIIIPNGAIYMMRTEALLAGEDWYAPCERSRCYAYEMPAERSLDINVHFEFEVAEKFLMEQRRCLEESSRRNKSSNASSAS